MRAKLTGAWTFNAAANRLHLITILAERTIGAAFRMANRYAVNILKNEGATIITLANAYFVGWAPPKLTLRLGPGDVESSLSLRNRAIAREVLTFQLERQGRGFWVSPPFRARVIAAGERPLEFELELLDPVDLLVLE